MTQPAYNPLRIPTPPKFASMEEARRHRKERLTASFRLFAKFGFDEGVAGHITARDPERPDHFWVNPFGVHFGLIKVSDLVLVNEHGDVVDGADRLATGARRGRALAAEVRRGHRADVDEARAFATAVLRPALRRRR